jgi:hypothetical protein
MKLAPMGPRPKLPHRAFEAAEDVIPHRFIDHPPDVEENAVVTAIEAKKSAVTRLQEFHLYYSAGVRLGKIRCSYPVNRHSDL